MVLFLIGLLVLLDPNSELRFVIWALIAYFLFVHRGRTSIGGL